MHLPKNVAGRYVWDNKGQEESAISLPFLPYTASRATGNSTAHLGRACTRLSNSGAPCNHPLYLSTLIAPLFTLFSISMTLWRLFAGRMSLV